MTPEVHTNNGDAGKSVRGEKSRRSASVADELGLIECDQRLRDFVRSDDIESERAQDGCRKEQAHTLVGSTQWQAQS